MDIESIMKLWQARDLLAEVHVDDAASKKALVLYGVNQALSTVSDITHDDLMATSDRSLFIEKLHLLQKIGPDYYKNLYLAIEQNLEGGLYDAGERQKDHNETMNKRARDLIKKLQIISLKK